MQKLNNFFSTSAAAAAAVAFHLNFVNVFRNLNDINLAKGYDSVARIPRMVIYFGALIKRAQRQ